ncbi:hypothetical protein LEMLEM_LOCUS18401 [Lemmus lemmus]
MEPISRSSRVLEEPTRDCFSSGFQTHYTIMQETTKEVIS